MGMRINGMTEAVAGFRQMRGEMRQGAQDTVDDSCDHLMKTSQIEVPKETGALSGTARFVNHSSSGNKRSKGVKYGEPGEGEGIIDYAAAVHEILKASHKSPTKAKYVEDPLVQGVPSYKRFGRTALKLAVRRAFK